MNRATIFGLALLSAAACAPAGDGGSEAQAGAAPSAPYAPDPADRAEILAALQSVFDALGTGDADLLRSVMDPSVVMHSSETDAGGATRYGSSTVEGLATRIASSEVPLIERMWDPVVHADGPLATVWTPYDFYAGSEFSHCGIDAAVLQRRADGWKVVALSWTRLQPPACALHPDGPPDA